MDDDEFKANVMRGLETLDTKIDRLESDTHSNIEHVDKRLDAVAARLDEQDAAHDRLSDKVDGLAVSVRQSLEASEQALTAVTNLGRRGTHLEHPDE